MNDVTKARLKIARGYLSGASAIATACGYGALSFLTRNHHRTATTMRLGAAMFQNAQQTIRQGEAQLAAAKRNG